MTGGLTIRVRCAVGSSNYDSWAFAAPLFLPESGTTSWCIDSSGNSKATNIPMNTYGSELGIPTSGIVNCP